MKRITKQELAQLKKMNPEAFIDTQYLETTCKNASESFTRLQLAIDSIPKRKSLFERFYNYMGSLINGNKSIAPAELKSFR